MPNSYTTSRDLTPWAGRDDLAGDQVPERLHRHVRLHYTVARYPTGLVDYLRAHGRKKVLFGSNHPFWPATDCLKGLDKLDLDDTTKQAFLYDNAVKVFGLS